MPSRHLRVVLLVGLLPAAAAAHSLGVPDAADEFARIAGSTVAFEATADVAKVVAPEPKPRRSEMRYFYRGGQTRIEPDLRTDTELPPAELQKLVAQKTDQRALLLRTEGRYIIYPLLRAYHPQPIPAVEPQPGAPPESSTPPVEAGRETVDGHPCRKYQLTRSSEGRDLTITKWEAEDLHGFPVQIEVEHAGGGITFRFRNVRLKTPAAALFELPSSYRRFESAKDLADSLAAPPH